MEPGETLEFHLEEEEIRTIGRALYIYGLEMQANSYVWDHVKQVKHKTTYSDVQEVFELAASFYIEDK